MTSAIDSQLKTRLDGKNILFICPQFFGYEKRIQEKLVYYGATVKYFDDRPSNSLLTKGIIRVKQSAANYFVNKYYNNILDQIKDEKFDFVLSLAPEATPVVFFEKVRAMNKSGKFILYNWDSMQNKPKSIEMIPIFDRILSFDHSDCTNLDIQFRPLFFIDKYKNLNESKAIYDLLFIGSAHSDRYLLFKSIVAKATKSIEKLNAKSFFYIQSKSAYYLKRLFDPTFKKVKLKDLSTTPLNSNEIIDLVSKSKAMLDIHHPKQNGLTMRTLEMLGANRKIVTTNQDVSNYNFYNPNNIHIIDRNNPQVEPQFWTSPFEKVDSSVKDQYSISGWLFDLFVEEKKIPIHQFLKIT